MRFADRIVWITGASSGIGEALAVAFSREGATVVLSARSVQELERVRSTCEGNEKHAVVPLDLADRDAIDRSAKDVLARFGRVDVLVHSGGISQRGLAAETPVEIDRRIMDVNYFGTIALTKAVLPSMIARKSGHIVPISSVIGYVGVPGRSAYSASKHALHGFFDALRAENAKHGIRVTIVCPGYVRTKVSESAITSDGSAYGKTDPTHANAMRPEVAAKKIVDGIAKAKHEVRVGGKEIYAILLQRFLPRLVARVTRMK